MDLLKRLRGDHMLLCEQCINAIKSRGEIVYVGSEYTDFEPDEEVKCEWCDEVDTVYDCILP